MISLGEELLPSPPQAPEPMKPLCSVDHIDTVCGFKRSLTIQLHHFELALNAAYERDVCLLRCEIDTLRSQLAMTSIDQSRSCSKGDAQDATHTSYWQEAPLCNLETDFQTYKPCENAGLASTNEYDSCFEHPNVSHSKPCDVPFEPCDIPLEPSVTPFEEDGRGLRDSHASSLDCPSDDDFFVGSQSDWQAMNAFQDEDGVAVGARKSQVTFDSPRLHESEDSVNVAELTGSKSQRRKARLRKVLEARLRSNWKLELQSLEESVPRWSRASAWTLSSNDWNEQGSTDYMQHHTSSYQFVASFKSGVQKSCVLHPQSHFRVVFDLLGILVMGYDFFSTPLMFFDLHESAISTVFGWTTRIFWTLDLWLNFHTASYNKGVLLTEFSKVAKQYLKTSFIVDFIIVIAEWLSYVLEATGAKSLKNVSLLRVVKVLRFLKVLRVFKLERILQQFKAQSQSTVLVVCLRPLFMVFLLLLVNHTIACLWYGIGESSSGWIRYQQDSSFAYMYATSFHWAVSQLHGNMEVFPTNLEERIFMAASSIVALILFSTFLSSITNSMMQVHALRAKRYELDSNLRIILAKRNVSIGLTMAIRKRMDYLSSTQMETHADSAVLETLPADLLIDLHHECRRPIIFAHSFFNLLDARAPRIIRKLCNDCMTEAFYLPEQKVFSAGDACIGMMFVISGGLTYEIQAKRKAGLSHKTTHQKPSLESQDTSDNMQPCNSLMLKRSSTVHSLLQVAMSVNSSLASGHRGSAVVERGSWLAEAILWLIWEFCGDLTAGTSSWLLIVDADDFAKVIEQFHWVHVNACRYSSNFIDRMVKQGVLTDIVPDEECFFEG